MTAILSSVDSVWFQYGTSDYDNQLAATPFRITDTTLNIKAIPTNLLQNTSYKVRVKLYYNGNYYYSDSSSFSTLVQAAPDITLRAGILYSSSPSGNQWYLNNVPIPGATDSSYTPTQAGSYSVSATTNGCTSEMSPKIDYVLTAIHDPLPPGTVKIYPNPVANTLYIQNNELRKLEIEIFNAVGVQVLKQLTSKKENVLDMRKYPSGSYFINVVESKTLKTIQKLIIKL